jgi:hypothetical protein
LLPAGAAPGPAGQVLEAAAPTRASPRARAQGAAHRRPRTGGWANPGATRDQPNGARKLGIGDKLPAGMSDHGHGAGSRMNTADCAHLTIVPAWRWIACGIRAFAIGGRHNPAAWAENCSADTRGRERISRAGRRGATVRTVGSDRWLRKRIRREAGPMRRARLDAAPSCYPPLHTFLALSEGQDCADLQTRIPLPGRQLWNLARSGANADQLHI